MLKDENGKKTVEWKAVASAAELRPLVFSPSGVHSCHLLPSVRGAGLVYTTQTDVSGRR